MQNQNKKITRWILGVGLTVFLLLIVAIKIAKTISGNNTETFESYTTVILLVAMFIYLILCGIGIVRYNKYAAKYRSEKLEKASKELTTEFKKVLLNYSEPISKDLFECQAKVDDGKIICKIQLNHEVKIESYEEFLRFFHFTQD